MTETVPCELYRNVCILAFLYSLFVFCLQHSYSYPFITLHYYTLPVPTSTSKQVVSYLGRVVVRGPVVAHELAELYERWRHVRVQHFLWRHLRLHPSQGKSASQRVLPCRLEPAAWTKWSAERNIHNIPRPVLRQLRTIIQAILRISFSIACFC